MTGQRTEKYSGKSVMIRGTKKYFKKISRAREFIFLLITPGVVTGLLACAHPALTLPLTPIAAQLIWTHNAQFARFYAADQNGDYTAQGLTVTLPGLAHPEDFVGNTLLVRLRAFPIL